MAKNSLSPKGLSARERLQLTIEHKDPGKVVVDMGSTMTTGINAHALAKLRDALGLEKRPIKIFDPFQLLGYVEQDVYEALGLDVAPQIDNDWTVFGYENKDWKPWKLPTIEGEKEPLDVLVGGGFVLTEDDRYYYLHPQGRLDYPPSVRLPKHGFYFDNIFRTYDTYNEDTSDAKKDFADDFAVFTDEQARNIEKNCDYWYNNSKLGLIGGGGVDGIGDYAFFPGPHIPYPKGCRTLQEWMMLPYTNPNYLKDIYAMQTEVALKNCEIFKQACGDKLQVLQISGTDFGNQRAQMISNDVFNEFYAPYYKQVNDWVHKNTNWKTWYHCCGSVIKLIPDFIKCGWDCLNPVQCSAAGMDPKTLKDTYGDKIVFWGGGVNTQATLPFGTPDDVYKEVTERLEIFAPGGGYVFNTIHDIQAPTAPENLIAMFKAVKDYDERVLDGTFRK
jgi:hypothetical protein